MPGIFNVGNSYSPNNKKITSKLTFDVGEKFSGKVVKGDNNEVTIKLIDGWEFSAVVEGDISELQNVLQRFTVEGYENGKLKLKLIGKSSGDEEISKDFTSIINKEGLKGNDKELLEAMIKFDIPLTKENIKEIKSLVQFLDKIKANPQEIEEFITKYLETKGIDVNSEVGEKLGNTLKEFFTSFKGLTKEDILLFIENGIDFNKENIDSYNNIFKGNSSINDLLKEFEKVNPSKIEVNNAKVNILSLLKSMTGKSEDIINVILKDVLSSQRNDFTSQDFERLFNNINNMDSSDALQKFTVEEYETGNLTLKLIDRSSGKDEISKSFSTVMNKESLKGNDKKLLEAMIKLDVPLNKENIKEIKSLVQFLDKIKSNPEEIEDFVTKYLETKGIDVNSEVGEKLGNTLKEFFTSFKGLTKEDIINVTLKNIVGETLGDELSKDFSVIINKESLKGNDKELLQAMTKLDMPLTKENIKDIKSLVQILDEIKSNPEEIEDFVTKYLETKGIDVNSEVGEKLGNTLKEFITSFKGLTKEDIIDVTLKNLVGETSGDELSKDFSAIINKESLKGNDEKLLEAMTKLDIPLTKENIKEIKSLVQFLDKIKANPQEIEEFITKYLETKGIDVNSEVGEKLGNTLKELFANVDPSKIEVNSINEESINIKDIDENNFKYSDLNRDENSLTSSSKFAKDVYQKTDSNNAKVSMLSLLKSMTGKSEDIINVTLKEVLTTRRNNFTSNDFERVFNDISNMDSSKLLEKLISAINDYSEIGNDISSNDFNNYLKKANNEKLGINESLNFSKNQLDKVLSEITGKNISLTSDEFEKLKDGINLKYSNMIEDASIKEEVIGENHKVNLKDETVKNNMNNETLKNTENSKIINNINEKEAIFKKEISQSNNIDSLKSDNTLEDGTIKNSNTKEIVQQIISKTGESNKEIIKDVLSALKSEGDISEKIINIIKNNINDIKIFNKFSGDYYYANLPVNINEREYPCKLIVKDNRKEGKKIDSKNVKMVITIDTKNLGIVDGYMKVNNRSINIDLKCAEKSVKILDITKKKLIDNIESMGFSVKVNVHKKLEEVSLTTCRDFFNTGSKVSLDRRV